MATAEQLQVSNIELPSKEEIGRVSSCVGTYLCAFSKEPFDEKWSVNGEKSSAFLLNPKTAGEFINNFFLDGDFNLSSLPDGGEKLKVKKELVLDHIDKTLEDPMTEYLFSQGWISEDELVELEGLRNNVGKSKDNFVRIDMPYPVSSVMESYVSATKDPVSMVFLGYQESPFKQGDEVKFLRIQPGVEIPKNIYPRVVCRYVTSNHPRFEAKQNVQDRIIEEVGYYLDEEAIKEVRGSIDPYAYTIFFGELAKIPSCDASLKMMEMSRDNYFNVLITTPGEIDVSYDNIADLIPTQMIFLSIRGTTVLLGDDSGSSKLFTVAKGLLKDRLGLDYEEKSPPLKFTNTSNQEVVIGIIKRVEE